MHLYDLKMKYQIILRKKEIMKILNLIIKVKGFNEFLTKKAEANEATRCENYMNFTLFC